MSHHPDKRRMAIVSACMRADGLPYFALNYVEVTPQEAENGIQYYLVEADLLLAGYEEPFVHFAQDEAPPFLLPAVREYLGLPPQVPDSWSPAFSEVP